MDSPSTPPPPPSYAAPATAAVGERAGFWRRFLGYLVDAIVFGLVGGGIAGALGSSQNGRSGVIVLVGIAYFTILEGSSSQSIGMRALGMKVVDAKTGAPIDYSRAFVRSLGRVLSGAVLLLGYLWVAWDKEKQGWHDKIASTYVVKT